MRLCSLAIASVVALAAAGCGGSEAPLRDCRGRVWVKRSAGAASVVGSWNGWATPGTPAVTFDELWQVARLDLPPGEHGYLVDLGDGLVLDEENPLSTFRTAAGDTAPGDTASGDTADEVSLLLIDDCSVPALEVTRAKMRGSVLEIDASFLRAHDGGELDPDSVVVRTLAGAELNIVDANPNGGTIRASGADPPRGKHTVVIEARDDDGRAAPPVRASVWREPSAPTWRDGVLYQVMIDRFRGDGGAILTPPATPARRAGGTLDGVRSAIEDGSLEALGVSALWLSPAYRNPTGEELGNDGRQYSSYHGYWPIDPRAVDERLGGEEALDRLVASAHARGMAVLLDVVPNHVHQQHPMFAAHADEGWFGDPGCVCGSEACPWATHLQTCWFAPYLPDVRWQHPAAMRSSVADTRWWLERFDLDGVRVDAVPMMPRAATRRIVHSLRHAVYPGSGTFLLGEIYTGPGSNALDMLRFQLGPDGLDSVFDFPLMWSLHETIARGQGDFRFVEALLNDEDRAFEHSGAVIARIVDNHDTPRFVSVAQGDAGGDPWDEPAVQPTDPEPYRRLEMALALIFTVPGLPVIYQGDEIGLAGAGDPDNRRVMPADDSLSAAQQQVRETTRALGRLRRCSEALRHGNRLALEASAKRYVYARGVGQAYPVVVALSTEADSVTVPLPANLPPGSYRELVSGASYSPADDIPLDPFSFRVLLRDDDPCVTVW
jgi:glycosidase